MYNRKFFKTEIVTSRKIKQRANEDKIDDLKYDNAQL